MRLSNTIAGLLVLPTAIIQCILAQQDLNRSSKRGLVYIAPEDGNTRDAFNWVSGNSDLTWYYNYGASPTPFFNNDTSFSFIPMFFSPNIANFVSTITNLTKAGTNITHILSFNEPDGSSSTGGSDISPSTAAASWISVLEPLRAHGIQLGAPAVTGSPSGLSWLSDFFAACAGACTADFHAVHWYGDFAGLVDHVQARQQAYPNASMWVTEYALPSAGLNETQYFFNQSAAYFDGLGVVERYSYFGSFRSDVSNVGADVAMLDRKGRLTDIGSWYLGGKETGNIPSAAVSIEGRLWTALIVMVGIWLCL